VQRPFPVFSPLLPLLSTPYAKKCMIMHCRRSQPRLPDPTAHRRGSRDSPCIFGLFQQAHDAATRRWVPCIDVRCRHRFLLRLGNRTPILQTRGDPIGLRLLAHCMGILYAVTDRDATGHSLTLRKYGPSDSLFVSMVYARSRYSSNRFVSAFPISSSILR